MTSSPGTGVSPSTTRRWLAVLVVTALTVVACGGDATGDDTGGDAGPDTSTSTGEAIDSTTTGRGGGTYADDAWWICHPDLDENPCVDGDLTATAIRRDLSQRVEDFEPANDPPVDCFYVYPTVHVDGGPNRADPADPSAEIAVTHDQAARLSEVCDVHAPLYPQATVPAGSPVDPAVAERAYAGVRDAFLHHLGEREDGRPFALVGNGQGADLLARLVREEIEPRPERLERFLSAFLVGATGIVVPRGSVVGGTFSAVPLCTDREQVGCVVTFHAYQRGVPPPAGVSPLYPPTPPGTEAACTNPAGLDGRKGQFRGAYFPAGDPGLPAVQTP
ncbi:MAG: DUF3089 domain-containing protein [Acidimicrobiia bacterium]|nr:DUF3089 domain-containing protein [Acidimicrobiia bacterium]